MPASKIKVPSNAVYQQIVQSLSKARQNNKSFISKSNKKIYIILCHRKSNIFSHTCMHKKDTTQTSKINAIETITSTDLWGPSFCKQYFTRYI